MIITRKTIKYTIFVSLKRKTIINRVLSIKEFVLVVHVTLVNPKVMQKLDGMNMIIKLKVQNHQNTYDVTSTTVLQWLSFQMLQKILRPGKHI